MIQENPQLPLNKNPQIFILFRAINNLIVPDVTDGVLVGGRAGQPPQEAREQTQNRYSHSSYPDNLKKPIIKRIHELCKSRLTQRFMS